MEIKELREKIKLSQQELADQTGISRDKIGSWEIGRGNPKAKDYNTLVNFFTSKGVAIDGDNVGDISLPENEDLHRSIQDLIELNKKQAETTRLHAEAAEKNAVARMREAENVSRMLALLEKKAGLVTAGDVSQTIQALSAKIDGVLGLTLGVAAGDSYHSREEALAAYRRQAAAALQEVG